MKMNDESSPLSPAPPKIILNFHCPQRRSASGVRELLVKGYYFQGGGAQPECDVAVLYAFLQVGGFDQERFPLHASLWLDLVQRCNCKPGLPRHIGPPSRIYGLDAGCSLAIP